MTRTIRDELIAIQASDPDGILRADAVLKWAKAHPKSALHAEIEWDAKKAALEYQLWQIRRIIQLNIVSESGEPQIVSLTIDRTKPGGGYRSIVDVVNNKQLSAVMLQDALQELDRVKLRFQRIKELTDVWNAVDKVRSRANRRKAQKELRAQA